MQLTQNLEKPWIVYVIETDKGFLYTGITTCLERRFKEHKEQKTKAKFFHSQKPHKIVFQEIHPDRSSALKKEAYIKSLTKKAKLELILRSQHG